MKNKILLYFISCFFLLFSCEVAEDVEKVSQEGFLKLYGSSYEDSGFDVLQTPNKDYFLIGTIYDIEKQNQIVIIKTDKYGNERWTKTFGGDYNDTGKAFRLDGNGNLYLTGIVTDSIGTTEILVMKISPDGNKIWSNTDDDKFETWQNLTGGNLNKEGADIELSDDGSLVIVGNTTEENIGNGNPEGVTDIIIIKTDASGNVLWKHNHGGPRSEYASSLKKINAGYLISGTSYSFAEPGQDKANMILIKTNLTGIQTDKLTFGGNENDYGYDAITLPDGSIIAVGSTYSNTTNGKSDIFVVHTGSSLHDLIWEKKYGGAQDDIAYSLVLDNFNDLALIGSTSSYGNGASDIYFLKIDTQGNKKVDKTFGNTGSEIGYAIARTHDDGYIISGSSLFERNSMATLLKLRNDGNLNQ